MLTSGDEHVVLDTRQHGVVLFRAFARSFFLVACGAGLFALGWPWTSAGAGVLTVAALLARDRGGSAHEPVARYPGRMRRQTPGTSGTFVIMLPCPPGSPAGDPGRAKWLSGHRQSPRWRSALAWPVAPDGARIPPFP